MPMEEMKGKSTVNTPAKTNDLGPEETAALLGTVDSRPMADLRPDSGGQRAFKALVTGQGYDEVGPSDAREPIKTFVDPAAGAALKFIADRAAETGIPANRFPSLRGLSIAA